MERIFHKEFFFEVQSNLAIRNFLVALKLFLNAKSSLSLWSKWQIGHRKWFLNTNLFLIKPFLIAKFDCTIKGRPPMDIINLYLVHRVWLTFLSLLTYSQKGDPPLTQIALVLTSFKPIGFGFEHFKNASKSSLKII